MQFIAKRLWALVSRDRLDRELREEIAAHLDMQEEEFRRGEQGDQISLRHPTR